MAALVGKEDSQGIQAAVGDLQPLGMDRGLGLYREEGANQYGLGMFGGNIVGGRTYDGV